MGTGERSLKRLIITGDDFGISIPVNEAIEAAHRNGVLTATCLMVGAPAAADAVSRAKRLTSLAVGLHLVVTCGRAVLPPETIPDLVDEGGRLDDDLARAGFRYFFIPQARRQLAMEIRAQFEAFRATGLPLDHVNAHNHMQLHPTVLAAILKIGPEFGLRAVRLPFEPFLPSWRAAPCRVGLFGRFAYAAALKPWASWARRRMRRAGISTNDQLFGMYDSGEMTVDRIYHLISVLPEGVSEIHLHPALANAAAYRHRDEFEALVDSRLAAALEVNAIKRIAFRHIEPAVP